MVSVKCAGVSVAKIPKNTHVRCGSVRIEKLLCAECAGVPKFAAHKYSEKNVAWITKKVKKSWKLVHGYRPSNSKHEYNQTRVLKCLESFGSGADQF